MYEASEGEQQVMSNNVMLCCNAWEIVAFPPHSFAISNNGTNQTSVMTACKFACACNQPRWVHVADTVSQVLRMRWS